MSKFNMKVARIEAAAGSGTVCITFQIDRGAVSFQVPIRLSVKDYDDTEMVQAARSTLHRIFVELAAQSRDWKLSAKDLRQLSGMNLRPK
jgi:DNA-binding FadR family transcriptional regulator